MPELTPASQSTIADIAQHTSFSTAAVAHMQEALIRSGGGMAQFDHPEFGGSGQWMRGGMTMISMSADPTLKPRIGQLCTELVTQLDDAPDADRSTGDIGRPGKSGSPAADWWPGELGRPNATGSQNEMRYAYFAQARRLAVDDGQSVKLFDTLDHQISGVAQHQAGTKSLKFSSQLGVVDLATLPAAGVK